MARNGEAKEKGDSQTHKAPSAPILSTFNSASTTRQNRNSLHLCFVQTSMSNDLGSGGLSAVSRDVTGFTAVLLTRKKKRNQYTPFTGIKTLEAKLT